MSPEPRKSASSTTPADLVEGIDAALARVFLALDVQAEARCLGVDPSVLTGLRDSLLDLRALSARARADGSRRSLE